MTTPPDGGLLARALSRAALRERLAWGACALAIVLLYAFADRTARSGGLGWSDGEAYGRITAHFHEIRTSGRMNFYEVSRVLPCALAHYGLRALGLARTPENIAGAFVAMNAASLVGALYSLRAVLRRLVVSTDGALLTALATFGSYFVVRNMTWLPVWGDALAFACGFFMLHAHLARRRAALLGIALLGSFTWPITPLLAALLLAFPARAEPPPPGAEPPKGAAWLAAVAVAAAVTAICYVYSTPAPHFAELYARQCTEFPARRLFVLSLPLLFGWQLLAWRALFSAAQELGARRFVPDPVGVALAVLLLASVFAVHRAFFPMRPEEVPTPGVLATYLQNVGFVSTGKPLVSLVAHTAMFGPMFLLVLFTFPGVARAAAAASPGALLALAFGVVMALDSESRHLVEFVALGSAFSAAALSRALVAPFRALVAPVVLLTLAWSRIWLPVGRLGTDAQHVCSTHFPFQIIWGVHGPYMTFTHYAWVSAGAVVSALVLARALRRASQASAGSGPLDA